jgi:hypothetical protein
MFQLLLCAVLIGSALNLVHGLGLSPQGQQQDLGQDVSYSQGQGQSGGNFAGGRQGGFGQQRGFDVGAGGTRPGFAGRSYDGQPAGEDARNYNFRIYTEPEYYGYESKFPGGKAMFKSYRSDGSSFGRSKKYVVGTNELKMLQYLNTWKNLTVNFIRKSRKNKLWKFMLLFICNWRFSQR